MKKLSVSLTMLALALALGLAFAGCDNGGDVGTEMRAFPENMLGEWSKDSGSFTVQFSNKEPDGSLDVVNGRFNFSPVNSQYIVKDVSGNSYTLESTHYDTSSGFSYSHDLNFTVRIGADGKLTISNSKEVPIAASDSNTGSTLSSFDGTGSSASDINGTYTKK